MFVEWGGCAHAAGSVGPYVCVGVPAVQCMYCMYCGTVYALVLQQIGLSSFICCFAALRESCCPLNCVVFLAYSCHAAVAATQCSGETQCGYPAHCTPCSAGGANLAAAFAVSVCRSYMHAGRLLPDCACRQMGVPCVVCFTADSAMSAVLPLFWLAWPGQRRPTWLARPG